MSTETIKLLTMISDFTYDGYEHLMRFLRRFYSIIPFTEYSSTSDPKLILRHDVDGSMIPALRLAELEHRIGIRSTFMVGFSMKFYNLFEESSLTRLRAISAMGHEIGLHYDARQYASYDLPPEQVLKNELRALETLARKTIRVIARHNVSLGGEDPFAESQIALNAYDPEFRERALYVSDSCRAWCMRDIKRLLVERPPRVQLLVHPMLWSDIKCTRFDLLDNFFRNLEEDNSHYREYWKSVLWSSSKVRSFDAENEPRPD